MKRPVALITGASRGIGKALAITYAKAGYDLILTCRENIDSLNRLAQTLEDVGAQCKTYQFDVGDNEATITALQEGLSHFKGIDVLINNAALSYVGLMTDMTHNDWSKVMQTNLDSLFHTCSLVVPLMVQQKSGVILNISSIWGLVGASCEVAYSASKGGVNSFTKALAKELAPSHIRVNSIACGVIDTDMNQWLDPTERQQLEATIGLGRLGLPEEVADLAYFLSSDKATYITGQILTIDGGMG